MERQPEGQYRGIHLARQLTAVALRLNALEEELYVLYKDLQLILTPQDDPSIEREETVDSLYGPTA